MQNLFGFSEDEGSLISVAAFDCEASILEPCSTSAVPSASEILRIRRIQPRGLGVDPRGHCIFALLHHYARETVENSIVVRVNAPGLIQMFDCLLKLALLG